MLILKAPLEIKAKTSYIRDPESFYHRITGSYALMETRIDEEDLLHITTTPPEIYVNEKEGVSGIFNNVTRNDNNYSKVEILNNLLNRIVVSADMNLTYQDRVFITDALYRLGIRDDRKFMNSFFKMASQTRNTNALIDLYLEQGEDLRRMVETVLKSSEKEKTRETEHFENEERNYLYSTVFERLRTGAIYQIVSNFNRSADYNEIDKNEYSLSEQTFAAQNILLSMMRENAHVGDRNLYLLSENTYEESLESASSDVTNVKNEINSAVLFELLQNIYRLGYEKFFVDKSTFFNFEDTFYKASDQVVQKLISSFGGSVARNDVKNVLSEIQNQQTLNELQLFSYSMTDVLSEIETTQIQQLLDLININEQKLSKSFEEYSRRTNFYKYEALSDKKEVLPANVLETIRLIGEEAGSDVVRNISDRILETINNKGNIYEIISDYSQLLQKEEYKGYITEQIAESSGKATADAAGSDHGKDSTLAALEDIKERAGNRDNLDAISAGDIIRQLISGNYEKEEVVQIFDQMGDVLEPAITVFLESEEIAKLPTESFSKLREVIKSTATISSSEKTRLTESFSDKLQSREVLRILEKTGGISEPLIMDFLKSEEGRELPLEILQKLKEVIRNTSEIKSSEKTRIMKALSEKQIEILESIKENEGERGTLRQELVNLISSNNKVRVSVKDTKRIRQLIELFHREEVSRALEDKPAVIRQTHLRELQILYDNLRKNSEEVPARDLIRLLQSIEVTGNSAKLIKEELINLLTKERNSKASTRETKRILELMELFHREMAERTPEEKRADKNREILRQIEILSKKNEIGGDTGEEPLKPFIEDVKEAEAEPYGISYREKEKELITETNTRELTDEDILRLTEDVNRIERLNEVRRARYLEAVKNLKVKDNSKSDVGVFDKTRKMAQLSLSSPEKMMETITNEMQVRQSREKEILSELKEIFPEQSFEIFQLLNKYQNNPSELIKENYFRNAEIGELIYDIRRASEDENEVQAKKEGAVPEIAAGDMSSLKRARSAALPTTDRPVMEPAQTVHKVNEYLSSDEINEQLELMSHNLKKQIKDEVRSDTITENHLVNAKEVVTSDNSMQQISQVNIQRMIDSTVRSEMNAISNQVLSKLERQMRNEKIRRGY